MQVLVILCELSGMMVLTCYVGIARDTLQKSYDRALLYDINTRVPLALHALLVISLYVI